MGPKFKPGKLKTDFPPLFIEGIDHMLRLASDDRVWIPLDDRTPPLGPTAAASIVGAAARTAATGGGGDGPRSLAYSSVPVKEAPPPPAGGDGDGYVLHQVCGKAGYSLTLT